MPNYNKVILIGNTTRDPELRYTESGTAIANVGIAVNERRKDKSSGEETVKVTFVDCTLFGRTAETAGQYLKKGDPVLLEGKLALDQWTDKQTGANRSKLKVDVGYMELLKRRADSQPEPENAPQAAPAQEEDPF